MSNFPKLHLIDRSRFPTRIQLPNPTEYTGQFFDSKLSPDWKAVEADSYAWFDSYGIYSGRKRQSFFESGFGRLAALTWPLADAEHLRPAMDYILWIYAFDDMIDEGDLRNAAGDTSNVKLAVDISMGVLRNPDTTHPRFKVALTLQSLFNRMRSNSYPGAIKRFIDATDLYTQAITQQVANRIVDEVPSVDEFILLRREASGVKLAFAILEYTSNVSLSDEVHEDSGVVELTFAALDVIGWVNDIVSFPVEQARGDTQNLVFIVMWNKQLDLQGAMDYVYELICARTRDFLGAKARLRSFGSEVDRQLALYVQGIEYWIQGSIEWQYTTPRYYGADLQMFKDTGFINLMDPIPQSAPVAIET